MEFVLIGPGQLGQLLLRQAGRDCLVIGQDADSTRQIGELYGCPWTTKIERAAEGEVIAVVVPASAVPSVLEQVASCAKPGAVVLNFATEAALRAVIALERELSDLGVPRALIDAALGGTVPGVSLSYQRGTLGGFARKIVQQIEEEG